jgi:hypothetical protein
VTDEEAQAIGCRPAAGAFGVFMVFLVATVTVALVITLNERISYPFLFAGLPVTGLLTSIGGDLAFAWPLDLTLWLVLGFTAARLADRPTAYRRFIVSVLIAAMLVGTILGFLVEPA